MHNLHPVRLQICSTFPGGANSMEQISTRCTYLPRGANYAHERNLLSHMYNLILDFNKLPIFSIRPCLKINYINRPFIKLKIMVSVATASSDMPGCKAEQLEFLVHGLRFARFFFRIICLLHLSNRKQSLPNPGPDHPMYTSMKRYPCMIMEYHPLRFV